MYTHQRYRFQISLTWTLLLVCISWHSELMALDTANVPLTKATPESQKLSSSKLNEAVTKITGGDYGIIHSLLITRNNYLVLENYFAGFKREDIHRIESATKSIASALIGIAIEQRKIKDVQSKVLEFFPEYKNIENLDSRKKNISLESVLTMTPGFQWDESSFSFLNPKNDAVRMVESPDSIKYVLDLPMNDSLGNSTYQGEFIYNSGCSMLLSGILKNSSGQTAEEFAINHLFKPLGIKKWYWSSAMDGAINTAWGLSLRPLDMARFGILFLNDGRWLKDQVVSKEWAQVSTRKHVNTVKKRHGDIEKRAYGYQWWRFIDDDSIVSNLAINDIYYALGHGGQLIIVVPHLNMVVVSTGSNSSNSRLFFDVLRDHIFPAVLN